MPGDTAATPSAGASGTWNFRTELCRFLLPLIIPGLLQGKSQTIVNPLLPIFVREDLHGSDTSVGLVKSAYSLAQLLSSGALGVAMRRLHYNAAACLSLGVLVATASLSFFAPSIAVLFVIRLAGGAANSAFDISRKTCMAAEVPAPVRGRVSALLASMQKWASMVSAILGGVIAEHLATRGIFLVQAAFCAAAVLCIALHMMRSSSGSQALGGRGQPPGGGAGGRAAQGVSLGAVARRHWRDLAGAGVFCSMLIGVRNTFMVALPLQAHNIHVSKQNIGLAVAVCRGVDFGVTFVAAGIIMDKCGNTAAAAPSLLIIGLAFAALPLCSSYGAVLLAGGLYGLGNGLAGGVVNNFAAALAPPEARTQFLGLWRTTTSLGGLLLPPAMGIISDTTGSFEVATLAVAGVAFLDVLWLLLMVRPQHRRPPEGAAAAGGAAAEPLAGSQSSQLEEVLGPAARAALEPAAEVAQQ